MVTNPSRRTTGITVIVLILVALVAGAIAAELVTRQPATPAASNQATLQPAAAGSGPQQTPMSATAIYKQDWKGVVQITTRIGGGFRQGSGTGSGIVLDKAGNILTNNHVIQGASQLQVTFSDGSTAPATVVSTNPAQDLATIKVSVSAASLDPLPLGNSNNVLVGDTVYAIGFPFGNPESMTAGVVSGLNRTDSQSGLHGLIQTDAKINPGNSGGPLLNTLGQVVGINDAIDSPVQGNVGVGFAIPINQARPAEGGNL